LGSERSKSAEEEKEEEEEEGADLFVCDPIPACPLWREIMS